MPSLIIVRSVVSKLVVIALLLFCPTHVLSCYVTFKRIYNPTRDWVDFTDVDTKQAETAGSHKAQTLQV